jgi:hypothetical protein
MIRKVDGKIIRIVGRKASPQVVVISPMNAGSPAMPESRIVYTETTDPTVAAKARIAHDQAERNTDWLQLHWDEIVPPNLGKYLAVAGGEAFVAGTFDAAYALAHTAHPEDEGILVRHLIPWNGPRIHAHRR